MQVNKINRVRLTLFVDSIDGKYLIPGNKYLRFRKIESIKKFVCMNQRRDSGKQLEFDYSFVSQYADVDKIDDFKIELDKFSPKLVMK